MGGGRRQRRGVLPFRQALPDAQRLARRRRVRPAECRRDERRPAPAGLAHAGRQPGGVAVQRDVAACDEPVQQGGGEFRQQRRLGFQAASRRFEIQHQGEAARCRCRRARGQAKANSSSRSNAGMPRRPSRRNVAGAWTSMGGGRRAQAGGRLRGGQQQQLAVGGEDGGAAVAGYDGRRVGQGNSRHGFQLAEVTADSLDAISPRRHHSWRLNHELVSAGILVRRMASASS